MDKLADKIAEKIYDKFDALGKTGKPIDGCEWTLLAGFVTENGGKLEVVSLATGTKCIGSKAMCTDGLILNDSHAEVCNS